MENKIAILDIDSVAYTAFHPNKVLGSDGNPMRQDNKFIYEDKTEEQIKESVNSLMHHILSSGKFSHYIGFIKGYKTISNRTKINPLYKANRPIEQPKFWNFTSEYFVKKWFIKIADYIEVDDAVNITRLNLKDSYITAIDGDLLMLEGTHYNWKKNEWVTVTKEEAETKFWSDMICGQPGDNLQGLKGKGSKYVEELFKPQVYFYNDTKTELEVKTDKSIRVFQAYGMHYKEFDLGLEEYYKTYKCLKILEKCEGFVIPEPIEYMGRMS